LEVTLLATVVAQDATQINQGNHIYTHAAIIVPVVEIPQNVSKS
jgi:hypothetical protein